MTDFEPDFEKYALCPAMAGECLTESDILAFYDGRLSPEALSTLERHVDVCAGCREWLSHAATAPHAQGPTPQPNVQSFPVGKTVAGRYRVLRFLGAGGMGEVYEVEDRELGERIALKTVRAVSSDESTSIARLKREVSLARKVTHPNVCRIFDFGVEPAPSSTVFFTMELLQGESLADRLRRGPMTVEEARPVLEQMVRGLEAAHQAGVVHRDLKSSYVMLVAAGTDKPEVPRVVLTDFGLARPSTSMAVTTHSESGLLVGSPAYMAPEQVAGRTVTPASDLYSLGIVLFEMVTGRLPFTAENPLACMTRRLQEPPPSPRVFAPSLPPEWVSLILRCLEREPEKRFASARQVWEAVSSSSKGRSWSRPAVRVGLGSVASVLLVSAGVWHLRRGPDGAERHATTVTPASVSPTPASASPQAPTAPAPHAAVAAPPPETTLAQDSEGPPLPPPRPSPPRRAARKSAAAPPPETAPAFLNIYSEPWAYVFINGRQVGTTPLGKVPVGAGEHRVRLVRPGGVAVERIVRLAPDEVQLISENLP